MHNIMLYGLTRKSMGFSKMYHNEYNLTKASALKACTSYKCICINYTYIPLQR